MSTITNILSITTPVVTAVLVLMLGVLVDVIRDHTAAINEERNRATHVLATMTDVLRRLDDVEDKLYRHESSFDHRRD